MRGAEEISETPRRVWYWVAPGFIIGAAVAGSVFADWLNTKAANTGDVTGEVVLWAIVAQIVAIAIATLVLVILEGPYLSFWETHARHSLMLYVVGALLVIMIPEAGHISHGIEYLALQAGAAVMANAAVLWLIRFASRGITA